jgi:hypothetical protein
MTSDQRNALMTLLAKIVVYTNHGLDVKIFNAETGEEEMLLSANNTDAQELETLLRELSTQADREQLQTA